MTILYIVFRAFAVVDSDLFADAVGDVGLIDDGIAFVSLVGENGLYRGKLPFCFSRRLLMPFSSSSLAIPFKLSPARKRSYIRQIVSASSGTISGCPSSPLR